MQAVVSKGPKSLALEAVPDPTPKPGELVLRVDGCGICGSDLHLYQSGLLPPGAIMGHEFAGELMESAEGFQAGDRFCAIPTLSCGTCARCLTGLAAFCTNGSRAIGLGQAPGALAEYVSVAPHNTVKLPAGVGSDWGALVEPLAVGLHAVNVAQVRPSDSALVMGAGPVGLAITLWLRHLGVRTIVVCEKTEGRRAVAERLGATEVVEPAGLLPATQRNAPDGIDVVFEATGVPGLIAQSLNSVTFRGRVVVVGVCNHPDTIFPLAGIFKEATVHFVLAYELADFQYTVAMMEQGRIDPAPMVTDRISLAEVPAMFDTLAAPTTQAKVLIDLASAESAD
ncbi:MAG: alcohol dehydrogenase catalytic domain-containing protein [Deltaproteobacteria bacterium]|nr:alcohol dehydrogenase catalytic domain-containing protein [Deltaproteobacteria bacterium]MBW2447423.1 alcohol dehydrogenase catalytic domain-containing protein [Deltaproteobacteria bacterium]